MTSANIFDIKRFGINDGHGIRTVFFLKGCPLRCAWCQNPEGLEADIHVWYARHRCVQCKGCVAACPEGAVSFDKRGVTVDDRKCTRCGLCVKARPTGALRFDATRMTVEEALREVEKDRVFYEASGGGVTLSGGECTMSPAFSIELLATCQALGINTAIETCLQVPAETLKAFLPVTDRIIADVKLADPALHKAYTGADNALILKNLGMLAETDCELLLRVPLIPGFTATEENVRAIGELIAKLPRKIPVELINYNPMCREKYEALRKTYPVSDTSPLDPSRLKRFRDILVSLGLDVQ
jgi:pyruvate formate lyase activating enzyme